MLKNLYNYPIFRFELLIILLGLFWVVYSKIISKALHIDFKKTLKKDLYTYLPLSLLLFCSSDLVYYRHNYEWVSGGSYYVIIVLLVIVLKLAVILDIKKVHGKYVYLLRSFVIICPSIIIYILVSTYSDRKPNESLKTEKLLNLYNAGPLALFKNDFEGVYKKKVEVNNEARDALVLIPNSRIEATLNIPPESYLRFGLASYQFGLAGWRTSFRGKGDGILFKLSIECEGRTKRIYTKYIDAKHYLEDRKIFDVNIDLSDYANRNTSIIFEVSGSPGFWPSYIKRDDTRDDFGIITDPQIKLYNQKIDQSAQNIILISLDTLRADHLGCYGYRRGDISPNIDKLAKQGVLFEKAISHSPWTTPSHMSIFTSLLPSYHRVNEKHKQNLRFRASGGNYRTLSENIPTLPGVLKSNGYITAAITGRGCMSSVFGFCLGFDTYRMIPKNSFADNNNFYNVTEWLERNKAQKFFLFLHTYRIHTPYSDQKYAHEVLTEEEAEAIAKDFGEKHIELIQNAGSSNGREILKALYDGGIHETDKFIGRLIDEVKRLNLYNNTTIILTSDHGEEFGDHYPERIGYHGHSLYDELLWVPLIMVSPGNFPKGKRIKTQVRLIDIMPTILDLSNAKFDTIKMQGVSLLPIIKGKGSQNGDGLVAISEATDSDPEKKSFRNNKYKYIYTVKLDDNKNGEKTSITDDPQKEELYDLEHDPKERHNLNNPDLSLKLKHEINKTLKNAIKTSHTKKTERRIKIDDKIKKDLRALGYIQ